QTSTQTTFRSGDGQSLHRNRRRRADRRLHRRREKRISLPSQSSPASGGQGVEAPKTVDYCRGFVRMPWCPQRTTAVRSSIVLQTPGFVDNEFSSKIVRYVLVRLGLASAARQCPNETEADDRPAAANPLLWPST